MIDYVVPDALTPTRTLIVYADGGTITVTDTYVNPKYPLDNPIGLMAVNPPEATLQSRYVI